jgi:FMN-dependent oxidoreductase (nitrilotriacetate monooxygenase family)
MVKEIRLNAFSANGPTHLSAGMWRHPDDRSLQHNRLPYWTDLAQTLERGKFDALFLADTLGVSDVHGGNTDAAVRYATGTPRHDPMLLVPAMAAVTRHLGFGITGNLTYEAPYLFARRLSTLDHLTDGRMGWNIVTGYMQAAARAMGSATIKGHDTRYDIAEEFMVMMYQLWEGSWQDGAVVLDREHDIFADPARVHRIRHDGDYWKLDAIHMVEPSPQRTPVLYQAGSSGRGREFAATHAESIFLNGKTVPMVAPVIADIKARAAALGRSPDDVLCFSLATVVVAETDALAEMKLADFRKYVSIGGALSIFSTNSGIDFSKYDPDDPLPRIKGDVGVHSIVDAFTVGDPNKIWTVRELAEASVLGGRGPLIVGSPQTVTDRIIDWVAQTGSDGLNLSVATCPGCYIDFVDMVVPEMQRRGVYKTEYRPGTLREKLTGCVGGALSSNHVASRFRKMG